MMPQRTVSHFFRFPILDQLDVAHTCRRPQMIHDRVRFIEPLRGENVLVRDAFVLVSRRRSVAVKPDVMFSRDFSQSLVIRHCRSSSFYKLPRAACSRSIASNSALKLPLPKLFAPLRWMISKKSVGRSSTGFVKICNR